MLRRVAAISSFIIPGLGQCLRGMWVEAALLVYLTLHLRLTLAGLAHGKQAVVEPLAGFTWGWFAFTEGATHRVMVMTVVVVMLHLFSAWHAGRAWSEEAVDATAT